MFSPGFTALLVEAVGEERARKTLEGLSGDPSVSIRLNPAKLRSCPFDASVPVPWSPWGFVLPERPVFTLDPLFHAGCYYVQDSSAMMVGEIFRGCLDLLDTPHPSVLDLCAAPGGKTTDLAASLRERFGDGFSLVSNEVMKKRFSVLRSNVRTWGDARVGVLSRDPAGFRAGAVFDIVVADVPCSGEGMFRKEEKAVEDWSEETVDFCAARQRRILSDIWPSLRPGGILVYSTCTFNRRENDGNVAWAASVLGGEVLDFGPYPSVFRMECGYALLPGYVPGEGQYVAAVRKEGGEASRRPGKDVLALFDCEIPAEPLSGPMIDVDRETALHYLHGDALRLPDAPLGIVTIAYRGHPLGAAKNLGTRCNNLYPKENRIRMNI